MKINDNRQVIIRKNEAADKDADICTSTDREKGTITIETRGEGWQTGQVTFPEQFLDDVTESLVKCRAFIDKESSGGMKL